MATVDKREVARHLERIAILKGLHGDNSFSISAYKSAAYNVTNHAFQMTREGLAGVPGINKIADVILEFVETGTSARYEELAKQVPVSLVEIVELVHGVGPAKAKKLYAEGITKLEELIELAEAGNLDVKLAKNVLLARDMRSGRRPIKEVAPLATAVVAALLPVATAVVVCGSFRRGRETVKDLDVALRVKGRRNRIKEILTTDLPASIRGGRGIGKSLTTKIGQAMQSAMVFSLADVALEEAGLLQSIENRGEVKQSLVVKQGSLILRCDLWVFAEDWWGSGALNYATGSKQHNEMLRALAIKKSMKVNEYGIFDRKTGKRLGGREESDLYDLLGVEFVNPEER